MKQIDILEEIIVDNFAGGGGASTGIELASGRPVAIAINHDPDAILLHKTNHPYTEHLQASVWDVDPVEVCRGRPVGLAWFSPDCKHFSKAKGAALVDRNIRGLAWIVLRWAALVRPRVIMLENVEEFQTWGPVRKGKPVKSKSGQTFRKWKQQLSDLGYKIEHRELVAADYGAPTTRKRFVLVARCDGKPIVWPERTHAPRDSQEVRSGKLRPWRPAAEIIDWSIPGYSIFASKQEIWNRYGVKTVRPLADNTMRRVIRGVDKFTIRSGNPFIVEWVPEFFDVFFGAIVGGSCGGMLGFDRYAGDYFGITGYEESLAQKECCKRMKAHTKDEILDAYSVCFRVAINYISLKNRYDNLKSYIDILNGTNTGFLKTVKRIEELYDEISNDPWSSATQEFDRLVNNMPDEVWLQ